jgi:hydroxymethylpyrimidine/phosphomethylpyrimidine kinase
MDQPAKVLTIGGSDSGGAAGIQADLKTFTALGVYGMSVLTAVTAQNSVEVAAVHSLPSTFVVRQLQAVLSDYGAAAIKIGFTGRAELIESLAVALGPHLAEPERPLVVVDPVLVNYLREPLFSPTVARAYVTHLFPLADLVTPNWAELALLAERPVRTWEEVQTVAQTLRTLGARRVMVTGWVEDEEVVDLLVTKAGIEVWRQSRLETANTHGSGDTLSAAIAALLGQGVPFLAAISEARRLTAQAIAGARSWQLGAGHGPVNHLILKSG